MIESHRKMLDFSKGQIMASKDFKEFSIEDVCSPILARKIYFFN